MHHATKHLDPHGTPWTAAYGYERPWRERNVWHSQSGPRSSLWKQVMLHVHRYYRMVPQAVRLVHLEHQQLPTHYQRMLRTISLPAKDIKDALQRTYLGEEISTMPVYCFPGSIPFSMTRADIQLLYNGMKKYVFLYKSDGARYLLGFIRVRDRPVAFLLDRRARITLLKVTVPNSFYDGTILDGELVKTAHETRFLQFQVFDVLCVQDRLVGQYDYITRMEIGHRLFHVWSRLNRHHQPPRAPTTASTAAASTMPNNNAAYRQEALRFLASLAPQEAPAPTSTTEESAAVWQGYTDVSSIPAPAPVHANTTMEPDEEDPEEELKAMMYDFNMPLESKEDVRKARMEKWLAEQIVIDMGAPFHVTIKRPYSLWEVRALVRNVIPYMPFACDGIIAQPVEDPILLGPCRNIKKWKRVHSVDVFWRTFASAEEAAKCKSVLGASPYAPTTIAADLVVVGLWVEWPERETNSHPVASDVTVLPLSRAEAGPAFSGSIAINNTQEKGKHTWRGVLWDKMILRKDDAKKVYEDQVVEVTWSEKTRLWEVTTVRKDKNKPNTLSTANVTWRENILTNPTLQEVFPFLGDIDKKSEAQDLADHRRAAELLAVCDPTITEPVLETVDHEHLFRHLLTLEERTSSST